MSTKCDVLNGVRFTHCTIKLWTGVSVQQGHIAANSPAVSLNARTVQVSRIILVIKADEMQFHPDLASRQST
jgi:hypothetical protein